MRTVGGVRVDTARPLVWALRAAVFAGLPAALAGVRLLIPAEVNGVLAPVVGLGGTLAAVLWAVLVPGVWPGNDRLATAYALAGEPVDWRGHVAYAMRVARRSPQRAEALLLQGLAEGSPYAYPALIALHGDAERVRAELVAKGSAAQLRTCVAHHDPAAGAVTRTGRERGFQERDAGVAREPGDGGVRRDAGIAATLQAAVVAREPGDGGERELLAAFLAESGRFDEAVGQFREAGQDLREAGQDRPEAGRVVGWSAEPQRVREHRAGDVRPRIAEALLRGGRLDDAREVLHGSSDVHALRRLALAMHEWGRTAEAENLLREHPQAHHGLIKRAIEELHPEH